MFNQKLHLSHYIDPIMQKILMTAFIKAQFSYYPLIWMLHDRIVVFGVWHKETPSFEIFLAHKRLLNLRFSCSTQPRLISK